MQLLKRMFIDVKVNWDASLDLEQRKMGIRVIAKYEEREIMAAVCVQKMFVSQPVLT